MGGSRALVRTQEFRQFLVSRYIGRAGRPLGDHSAKSYCAYAAQAERLLRRDLDELPGAEFGELPQALRAAGAAEGVTGARLNNCESGLRAYLQFLALG